MKRDRPRRSQDYCHICGREHTPEKRDQLAYFIASANSPPPDLGGCIFLGPCDLHGVVHSAEERQMIIDFLIGEHRSERRDHLSWTRLLIQRARLAEKRLSCKAALKEPTLRDLQRIRRKLFPEGLA